MPNTPTDSGAVIRREIAVNVDPAIARADVDGAKVRRDTQLVQPLAGDQHAGAIDVVGSGNGHVPASDDGEERIEPDERADGEGQLRGRRGLKDAGGIECCA